jgi:hypothetical protein
MPYPNGILVHNPLLHAKLNPIIIPTINPITAPFIQPNIIYLVKWFL